MPNFESIVKATARTITEHSPEILTAIGVGGVFTTAILAVKATPKAMQALDDELMARPTGYIKGRRQPLTKWEMVKIAWKYYIPATGMAVTTAACIVGVNSIHSRRNAALASLYTITETAFKEYQAKVVETAGPKEDTRIKDSIAQDRLERASSEVFITGAGEQLCYDSLTGRLFRSDIEAINKAVNEINATVLRNMYASQNDFYELIGLDPVALGEELGWTLSQLLEVSYTGGLTKEQKPCVVLNYPMLPKYDYYRMQ
jgi:hypothetical protein